MKNFAKKEIIFEQIAKILSNFKEIEFGYILGSFLKREDFRDIDLAILFSEKLVLGDKNFKFAMKVAREVEKGIKPRYEVDIRPLNSAPFSFKYEVTRNGKLIYSKDEVKRIRFEEDVLSEYLDYKDVMDWFDQQLLSRI